MQHQDDALVTKKIIFLLSVGPRLHSGDQQKALDPELA